MKEHKDLLSMGAAMEFKRSREKNLNKRMVAAREAAGFSITEAARKLGFRNYQTLSAMEKGTRSITADELMAMARLYGRSL